MNPYNNPDARFIKKIKETCEKNNLNTNEDLILYFLNNKINYQFKFEEFYNPSKEKNIELNNLNLNVNDSKGGELLTNNTNFINSVINDNIINSININERLKSNEKSFKINKEKYNENIADEIDMNIINENSMSTIINNSNKNPFIYKVKVQNKNNINDSSYRKNLDYKGIINYIN
jgi:hypothetical protein